MYWVYFSKNRYYLLLFVKKCTLSILPGRNSFSVWYSIFVQILYIILFLCIILICVAFDYDMLDAGKFYVQLTELCNTVTWNYLLKPHKLRRFSIFYVIKYIKHADIESTERKLHYKKHSCFQCQIPSKLTRGNALYLEILFNRPSD